MNLGKAICLLLANLPAPIVSGFRMSAETSDAYDAVSAALAADTDTVGLPQPADGAGGQSS